MNLFSELREGFGISWDALRAHKLRSSLTTLGIVIGIVTVTLMGTAIEGLNRAFLKSISFIGTDVLYVQRFNWFNHTYEDWMKMQKRRPITMDQCESLAKQLTLARAVAPTADSEEKVQFKKRHSDSVYVIGTTAEYLHTGSLTIGQGRFLSPSEAEGGRPVCVIGTQIATNLFPRESPLGNKIMIGDRAFEVVGVLDKLGSFLDGSSLDNQAIIPLKQFTTSFWSYPDYQIQVKAIDPSQLEETKEEVRTVMRRIRRLAPNEPDDFAINQQDQFVDMFHRVAGTIAAIGLFITGLSLFVGGIGIMNIMFVSVAERTREIGIRKAIGARRGDIVLQFLTEAVVLTVLGGMLGMFFGWLVSLAARLVFPSLPTAVPLWAAILGVAVSVGVGLFFGIWPATRAARLDPVVALRYE